MKKESYNKYKKVTKFIFNVISWVVLILMLMVAGFLLYYLITTKIGEQKGVNNAAPFSLYTIISPSMEPTLKIYDIIIDLSVENAESIQIGDIITFVSRSSITKDMIITHRVVGIVIAEDGIEFITKGDNNNANDSTTVPYENVLGKVYMRIPFIGRIQSIMSTKGGWLIIVIIPALLIIGFDIFKLIKLSKAKKNVNGVIEKEEEIKQQEIETKKEIEQNLRERYRLYDDKINEEGLGITNQEKDITTESLVQESNEKDIINSNAIEMEIPEKKKEPEIEAKEENDEKKEEPKMGRPATIVLPKKKNSMDLPKMK